MNPEKMSETDIQNMMMLSRCRETYVCPNFTPRAWWECDLFQITQSGYSVEYEIKRTRSDFFADFKKLGGGSLVTKKYGRRTKKHDLLVNRTCLPCRYWFVVIPGIVTIDDIPEYAGLIEIGQDRFGRAAELVIKKAPQLHKEKLEEKERSYFFSNTYHRYHTARLAEVYRLKSKNPLNQSL